MLFEGQPDFSLVSNGAECVMIDKKFFMEHASHSLIVQLKGVVRNTLLLLLLLLLLLIISRDYINYKKAYATYSIK